MTVLLFLVLSMFASMSVSALECGEPTISHGSGPLYKPHSPFKNDVCNGPYKTMYIALGNGCVEGGYCYGDRIERPAEQLNIAGRVTGLTKDGRCVPVPNAVLDLWQVCCAGEVY
jgi:hypothetical protein